MRPIRMRLETVLLIAAAVALFVFAFRALMHAPPAAALAGPQRPDRSLPDRSLPDRSLPARSLPAEPEHPVQQQVGRFRVQVTPGSHTVLVLDLDETLVHSTMTGTGMEVSVRPHVHEFLVRASSMFDELAVFTAGTRPYAEPIIDSLEAGSGVRFRQRFYRDSCTPLLGAPGPDGQPTVVGYAKDLRIVWPDLGRVLLLDNTPTAYSLQPSCGVPIASFYGDPDDALLDALPVLALRRIEMAAPPADWDALGYT